MADVREKILSKYEIDIDKENVLKLYKIDSDDISPDELEIKIKTCRKKWNQSINGANEKFAERDRGRLEKADRYEQILRNKKLRKELFLYYNKGTSSSGNTSFAREYFTMIALSKKIDKKDVDFYFKYFQNERKNKKVILEMLKTEFKVHALGKEDKFASDGEEVEVEGKKKNENSPLITNLFQEATIMKIHKCEQFLEKALVSPDVKSRYPQAEEGLYTFLEIEKQKDLKAFTVAVAKRREEAANYRLDRGQIFTPIVDLFNTIAELITYKDVVDNFSEFKLLLKYPKLSPYMYIFDEIKPTSLKKFFAIANTEYPFRDLYDFVLNYFQPIYDNFGILDKGIGSILKKAEKKAKSNKVLNVVDDLLGIKRTKKIPLGANIIHYAVYWPIYILYFIFGVSKVIIRQMRKVAYPLFAVVFLVVNMLAGDEGLFSLRYIFNKEVWIPLVTSFIGDVGNIFEIMIGSLAMILAMLMINVIPALFISLLFYRFSERLSQSVDWVGLERTFQEILKDLRYKTEKQYTDNKDTFFKKKIPLIFVNIVCVCLLAVIIYFLPIGFKQL